MLISERNKKLAELKQAVREHLVKEYGEPLPADAMLMLFVFDAAAHVNIVILGRDPEETLKALRGEKPE